MRKYILGIALFMMTALTVVSCRSDKPQGVKIDQDRFSVVMPTGWEQDVTGEGKFLYLNLKKTKNGTVAKLSFHSYANRSDAPAVLMRAMCREKNGWEYQADQKLGDNTWSIAYAPNNNKKYAPRHNAFTALKNGVLCVQLENIDINDAEAKAILESVEVK